MEEIKEEIAKIVSSSGDCYGATREELRKIDKLVRLFKLYYYFGLRYPAVIEKFTEYNGEEYFGAEIPDLPGCGAEGRTKEEALERLQEAKRAWIEVSLERGLTIPEPGSSLELVGGGLDERKESQVKEYSRRRI